MRLNQQVGVSHKFINTIFSSYILLNHQVTVFRKYINTIFPTYIQQYAMKFNNCLSKIYQHNFSDLYTIKSTSLSQIYQHNFPSYIRLNQQVTVSQKSFHNRLNNESFPHMQKKLKYLLRGAPSPSSQGREGKGETG